MSGWKLVPVAADREAIDPAFERTRYDAGYSSHVELANALVAAAPSPPEDVLERMARAHDREDSAKRGEPSPWDIATDAPDFAEFRAERIEAMRSALAAAEERKDD